MLQHKWKSRPGFTLIELAIVLGVVGVVSAGLWRLMSASNQQTKDQATAQQQLALIAAVKGFLADQTTYGGQAFLNTIGTNGTVGNVSKLAIPSSCSGQTTYAATFCNYLPSGFTSGTTNPYGQKYYIQVKAGNSTAVQDYSFMIVTEGGSTIPDADGGRIANLIGADGGFIYSSALCTAAVSAKAACGALGAWQVTDVTAAPTAGGGGYSFGGTGMSPAPTSGDIASQSFVATSSSINYQWLARAWLTGDNPDTPGTYGSTPPVYNTMVTDMYMGNGTTAAGIYLWNTGSSINLESSALNVDSGAINVNTGTINVNTGVIHLDGGFIDNSAATPPAIDSVIELTAAAPTAINTAGNPLVSFAAGCTIINTASFESAPKIGGTLPVCNPALSITGDAYVTGAVTAQQVFTTSDARAKVDIRPIRNALDDLMRLDPVMFTYKETGSKGMGVTAQNVETVYPYLVLDTGVKHVDYNGLMGPLIESVQELKRQNDDLRQQLKEQSVRIKKLEGKGNIAP